MLNRFFEGKHKSLEHNAFAYKILYFQLEDRHFISLTMNSGLLEPQKHIEIIHKEKG